MKGTKLIPLEDFVLEQIDKNKIGLFDFVDKIESLAKLLKSTPKLSDFIPCDLDGNPLEHPSADDRKYVFEYHEGGINEIDTELFESDVKAYQEAVDRVLWEGDFHFVEDDKYRGIQIEEDYLLWDKKTNEFGFKVYMIFFNPNIFQYSQIATKEDWKLTFKRDL